MNKLVVCTHAGDYNSYKTYWDKSGLDFTYLTDVTNAPLDVGLQYDEKRLKQVLNLEDLQVSKKHYWNAINNRNIIWFYAHFRMLYYFIQHPNHPYYWFFDDDVTADNWDVFFDGFKNNNTDFISYFCFKDMQTHTLPHIPNIDNNTTSEHLWFERFPGDGDLLFNDTTEYLGSFFPVVRLSNLALTKLVDVHKNGLHGYSEGFVPTILNYFGYTVDTIYDNQSQSKHFDDNIVKLKHKHQHIGWNWI